MENKTLLNNYNSYVFENNKKSLLIGLLLGIIFYLLMIFSDPIEHKDFFLKIRILIAAILLIIFIFTIFFTKKIKEINWLFLVITPMTIIILVGGILYFSFYTKFTSSYIMAYYIAVIGSFCLLIKTKKLLNITTIITALFLTVNILFFKNYINKTNIRLIIHFYSILFITYVITRALINASMKDYHNVVTINKQVIDLEKAKEEMQKKIFYDHLTNLPNRRMFIDRFEWALSQAKRYSRTISLMFLDLDNFKRINDTLGHRIGDQLLCEISKRLLLCVRSTDYITHTTTNFPADIVARLGGDEFTILLTEIQYPENSSLVAQRIINALKRKITIDQNEIFISPSIGIAIFPHDGSTVEELIKNADSAMYDIKKSGKNNYQYFQNSLHSKNLHNLSLENDLRHAIKNDEFIIYYQPQVEAESGKIFGLEALVRWQHPKKGLLMPNNFIPLAENIGIINTIGDIVLKKACLDYNHWIQNGIAPDTISVNFSSKQFYQKNLYEKVTGIINECNIEPSSVVMEITETCIFDTNNKNIINIIYKLKDFGIKIALDDFGIDFSSLKIIQTVPIDIIKIDYSFIQNILTNKKNKAIINGIMALAQELDILVIAEGVERKEQLEYLNAKRCNLIQGYYFYKPQKNNKIHVILSKEK